MDVKFAAALQCEIGINQCGANGQKNNRNQSDELIITRGEGFGGRLEVVGQLVIG
jgi:hypothetical protein